MDEEFVLSIVCRLNVVSHLDAVALEDHGLGIGVGERYFLFATLVQLLFHLLKMLFAALR